MRRSPDHRPLFAKALAQELPAEAWHSVTWREGTNEELTSCFAAVRVRPASRDHNLTKPRPEEWLLIEWPQGDAEPLKCWLSTLPPDKPLHDLVATAKLRWRIERDYRELKQELGLGHYEGRGWRDFHHHASLCIAAYGFLIAEREAIPPSAPIGSQDVRKPPVSRRHRPNSPAHPTRAACLEFRHHHAPTDHRRARPNPVPMSMLHQSKRPASIRFMTQ